MNNGKSPEDEGYRVEVNMNGKLRGNVSYEKSNHKASVKKARAVIISRLSSDIHRKAAIGTRCLPVVMF